MKTKAVILVAVAFLVFMIGCSAKPYMPATNEEIYGTWTNPNYGQQKLVRSSDGTWKSFTYPTDTVPISSGTFQLVKKWKDSDGNTWYQENVRVLVGVYKVNTQQLDRIDKTGKVFEAIFQEVGQFDDKNYPTKLDPKSESYGIFSRSE